MAKIGAMMSTSLYNIDPNSRRTKCISVEKITVYFNRSSFNSDEYKKENGKKKQTLVVIVKITFRSDVTEMIISGSQCCTKWQSLNEKN